MHRRLIAALGAVAIVLLATPDADASAAAATDGASNSAPRGQQASAAQQLAEKFAPVLMMTAQAGSCDKNGDPYFPSPVDFLFNNPDVKLRAKGDGNPVLKSPVTPPDLASAGPNVYLDLPGNPRQPGCDDERYFRQKVAALGLKPTTYAHVVDDPVGHQLWVEYWFYYYFNDWNDTHESDWEMVMAGFNASTPEEALRQMPAPLAFAARRR